MQDKIIPKCRSSYHTFEASSSNKPKVTRTQLDAQEGLTKEAYNDEKEDRRDSNNAGEKYYLCESLRFQTN